MVPDTEEDSQEAAHEPEKDTQEVVPESENEDTQEAAHEPEENT